MGMGDCRACRLGRECRRGASGHDHSDLPPDQIGRQRRQSVVLTFRPTVFDRHILAFDIARFLQTLVERRDLLAQRSGRSGIEEAGHWHRRLLLRACGKRPCCRTAKEGDELAPSHVLLSTVALQPTTPL